MNFMQLLKSLDDLLYEVMSWLVFYPLTLWRTLTAPLQMMAYADTELLDEDSEQYDDTLSPPLFLLITLLISHGLEIVTSDGPNPIVEGDRGLASMVNDDTSLLVLRLAVFSLIPLMLAVSVIVGKKQHLTRERLKAPFYAQCYPAAPFALLLGIGTIMADRGSDMRAAGLALVAAVIASYFLLQVMWFRRQLTSGTGRALAHTFMGFMFGIALTIIIAQLLA